MSKKKSQNIQFSSKLILNQWLISLFGVDPLDGTSLHPFQRLITGIKDDKNRNLEGIGENGLHRYFEAFTQSELFFDQYSQVSVEQLRVYEENIVAHTRAINKDRSRPVVWKYFQWLTLLFVEIYLDRYFGDKEKLQADLNTYLKRFNEHYYSYVDIGEYELGDLNKICLQNATGSGKTLLMHVNILQFRHYAKGSQEGKEISKVILLSPNERLSQQHDEELRQSGFGFIQRLSANLQGNLDSIEITEITKLADAEGPNTIATRSLGDQNLLLVDEGHRGMSGKEEGIWFQRRSQLSQRGFVFEYSATFAQAVAASGNAALEDSYAKSIIFDYSYRWFYEDGYGKDYQIFNIKDDREKLQDPKLKEAYLTGALLRYYQQLCIYQDKHQELMPFNLEKPLWVFVGSTVSKGRGQVEREMLSDVGEILVFFARFLSQPEQFKSLIDQVLTGDGSAKGLEDNRNNYIFYNSFRYLPGSQSSAEIYQGILRLFFQNSSGGRLRLERRLGDSGEVELFAGGGDTPFGLINVGDAKGLCDSVAEYALNEQVDLDVLESDFGENRFAAVRDSSSPINLLVGSKKFIEGWDCWRVSCMGLMHVGKSEGTQIIQLFGRGVRLKGLSWSLKRSHYVKIPSMPKAPSQIKELETLNVFGIDANFMESFRDQLKEEGLPGNDSKAEYRIPMNVIRNLDKKLKVLRVKNNKDGKAYSFERDGYLPGLLNIPDYIISNKVRSDWYTKVQVAKSLANEYEKAEKKKPQTLDPSLFCFLDFDHIYFELENYKRQRNMSQLNLDKLQIQELLRDNSWYDLFYPRNLATPLGFQDIEQLQKIAISLLTGYLRKFYEYHKTAFFKNRYEYAYLEVNDKNLPEEDFYTLSVDSQDPIVEQIERLCQEIKDRKKDLIELKDLKACYFDRHLYQPLIHVANGGRISIAPVSLNESEFKFVNDMMKWANDNQKQLEIYLLRNLSRGKGMGFFEAGNFHPDFILWVLQAGKQYIHFIEPHGMMHDGPEHPRVQFHKTVKDIEQRLNDKNVELNSWVLSATPRKELEVRGYKVDEYEKNNVLFMEEEGYLDRILEIPM